jgi:hypothetical protein
MRLEKIISTTQCNIDNNVYQYQGIADFNSVASRLLVLFETAMEKYNNYIKKNKLPENYGQMLNGINQNGTIQIQLRLSRKIHNFIKKVVKIQRDNGEKSNIPKVILEFTYFGYLIHKLEHGTPPTCEVTKFNDWARVDSMKIEEIRNKIKSEIQSGTVKASEYIALRGAFLKTFFGDDDEFEKFIKENLKEELQDNLSIKVGNVVIHDSSKVDLVA